MSECVKHISFINNLLTDLNIQLESAVPLYEDNQAAIQLATDATDISKIRHLAAKYHLIREYVADGSVVLKYCPTTKMLADMMTKALPQTLLRSCIQGIHQLPLTSAESHFTAKQSPEFDSELLSAESISPSINHVSISTILPFEIPSCLRKDLWNPITKNITFLLS